MKISWSKAVTDAAVYKSADILNIRLRLFDPPLLYSGFFRWIWHELSKGVGLKTHWLLVWVQLLASIFQNYSCSIAVLSWWLVAGTLYLSFCSYSLGFRFGRGCLYFSLREVMEHLYTSGHPLTRYNELGFVDRGTALGYRHQYLHWTWREGSVPEFWFPSWMPAGITAGEFNQNYNIYIKSSKLLKTR